MRVKSETDWTAVKAANESDEPIKFIAEDELYDPNDEAATAAAWAAGTVTRKVRGPQKAPTKKATSIRLSSEVIDHYKARGKGWQAAIDEELKRIVTKKVKSSAG